MFDGPSEFNQRPGKNQLCSRNEVSMSKSPMHIMMFGDRDLLKFSKNKKNTSLEAVPDWAV